MGSEGSHGFFNAEDFSRFRRRLDEETALLGQVFAQHGFSSRDDVAGFELEAWLVDAQGVPLADNQRFLEELDNPPVVPDLAKFNIEISGSPCALATLVYTIGKQRAGASDCLIRRWRQC